MLQQAPNVEPESLTLSWQNWSSKQSWQTRLSCAWAGSPGEWQRASQIRTAGHRHGLPLPSLGRRAFGMAARTSSCMSWRSWGNKTELLSSCEWRQRKGCGFITTLQIPAAPEIQPWKRLTCIQAVLSGESILLSGNFYLPFLIPTLTLLSSNVQAKCKCALSTKNSASFKSLPP